MNSSAFFRPVVIAVISILASCATYEPLTEQTSSPRANPPLPAQESPGEKVARHLSERYADTRKDCGRPSQPSFLCNGIMIRATADNANFHVWNNSPASINKGGVSFSYLRADSNIPRVFNSNSGYIFTSYFFAGSKLKPEALCMFPIDAATDRRGNAGCGEYPGLTRTDLCHLYGITSAAQWWEDYRSHNPIRHYWQCGFDIKDSRNDLAGPAFQAGIDARHYLNAADPQNEMIVKAWEDNLGKQLPLEAFFYISGSPNGLNAAKRNQLDLKTTDGITIPIIKINLTPPASFSYNVDDQVVPPAF